MMNRFSDFAFNLNLRHYTMACSLDIDTLDAAVIAATLANRGTNPTTKEHVLPEIITDQIINVMMSCGMYNGAGKWIVDVGVPAKSGVSGVIMGVVPGVCGFAVFSPCLDEHGNSTRGVLVAKALSDSLGLHVLKNKSSQDSKQSHKEREEKEKQSWSLIPRTSGSAGKSAKVAPEAEAEFLSGTVRSGDSWFDSIKPVTVVPV
jgi:hypothetical protein